LTVKHIEVKNNFNLLSQDKTRYIVLTIPQLIVLNHYFYKVLLVHHL
jgi:hypothetical protein